MNADRRPLLWQTVLALPADDNAPDVLDCLVEFRRIVLGGGEQSPRGNCDVHIAHVDSKGRRGKEVLFYVPCPYGSLRLDREGPTMKRSSLMHCGTLHALIQSTDKERKSPAARMAGAPDSFRVYLGPGQ